MLFLLKDAAACSVIMKGKVSQAKKRILLLTPLQSKQSKVNILKAHTSCRKIIRNKFHLLSLSSINQAIIFINLKILVAFRS